MNRGWRTSVVLGLVGTLIAALGTAAMAQPASSISIPLAQALQAPMPVDLALGQPAIIRLERPVVAVTDSPPGLVHAIIHGSAVLVVPVREGSTALALGLGGNVSAKLAVSIGTAGGARAITIAGPSVASTARRSDPTEAPRIQSDPPSQASVSTADPPDPPAPGVNALIATMSSDQRQALVEYLRSPSFASLSTLVRLLSPSQQHMLVEVLANHSPLPHDTVQASQPARPAVAPPSSTTTAASTAPPTKADPVDPGVTVSAPDGIALHVLPTRTGGILYLSYVVQNHTGRMLRADPHDIDVVGAHGAITVRQMDVGTPGEIAAGSMETGVIALTPASARVSVTWRLRDDAGDAVSVGILVTNPR